MRPCRWPAWQQYQHLDDYRGGRAAHEHVADLARHRAVRHGGFFQLVNLPVEFDASARAQAQLVGLGIINNEELTYVSKVLNAAALTYVAATLGHLSPSSITSWNSRATGDGKRHSTIFVVGRQLYCRPYRLPSSKSGSATATPTVVPLCRSITYGLSMGAGAYRPPAAGTNELDEHRQH